MNLPPVGTRMFVRDTSQIYEITGYETIYRVLYVLVRLYHSDHKWLAYYINQDQPVTPLMETLL